MSKVDYHEGIPIERLKELEGQGITEYRMKISRRGDGGTLASLKTVLVTLAEMSTLDDMLNRYAGGGAYVIQCFHPEESLNRLFAFRLSIVGSPKIPADRSPNAANMPQPPPDTERTFSSQLFSAPERAAPGTTFGPPLMQGAPYASPTDQIAMGTVDSERARHMRLEAKLEEVLREREAERAQHAAHVEDDRKERDRIAQEAERQQHAAEIKRLEDLITNSAKPKFNFPEMLVAATPLIPVLVALIDSRKHSASIEAERMSKMNEIQMAGANRLMEATLAQGAQRANDGDGTTKLLQTILPLALPVITTLVTANGPKAQAELMTAQADVQMQQVAMLAQMVEQVTAQTPDSPYLPMIESMIATITAGVQAYAKSQTRPSTAQAVLTTVQQQLGGGAPPTPALAPAPAQSGRSQGEQVADAVFAHPAYPDVMKTQEWFTIVAMLHDGADAEVVGEALAAHLSNLDGAGTTPEYIEPVWAQPEETLTKVFSFLPIWQTNIVYAKAVIKKVIAVLSAPLPEGEEEAAAEVVEAVEEAVPAEPVQAAAE
jgi:hypothetical protein